MAVILGDPDGDLVRLGGLSTPGMCARQVTFPGADLISSLMLPTATKGAQPSPNRPPSGGLPLRRRPGRRGGHGAPYVPMLSW
jgi:hypothetical protein